MSLPFRAKPAAETLPLTLLTRQSLPVWRTRAGAVRRAWVQGSGVRAAPGEICLLPGRDELAEPSLRVRGHPPSSVTPS